MEIKFISGIYKILNTVNCKLYVGSAVNIENRWKLHRNQLKRNVHKNKHLQASFNKYGEQYFVFEVIEYCEKDKLIEREQVYIDWFKPQYNVCKIAGSLLGFRHSEETKEKFKQRDMKSVQAKSVASRKGKSLSNDHIERIINSRKGYTHTEETKIKIGKSNSISKLGSKYTEETKAKMRLSMTGLKRSEKAKLNMIEAWKKRRELKKN